MFQRSKERREDIDHEAIGFGQNVTDFLVNQRVEDDRPATVLFRGIIDLLYHGPRFFRGVDVRARQFRESDVLELCQKTLAQGFRGDACAVRNEESSSFHVPWALSRERFPAIVGPSPSPVGGGPTIAGNRSRLKAQGT